MTMKESLLTLVAATALTALSAAITKQETVASSAAEAKPVKVGEESG